MRITPSGATNRNAWYDRNPTSIQLSAGAGLLESVAPHALVNRFSYTVPSARKFLIGMVSAMVCRTAVATTPVPWNCQIRITPNAGTLAEVWNFEDFNNVVGSKVGQASGWGSVLQAGDLIVGADSDGSTAGTTTPCEGLSGTEFDA